MLGTRVVAILLAVAVVTAALLNSQTTVAAQDGVGMVCSVPPAVTLGEPVLLECRIDNALPVSIDVDYGWNRAGAFEMQLRAPGGEVQRVQPGPRGLGGIGILETTTILPGAHHVQRLLLNRWFEWSTPGQYRLTVQFSGPVITHHRDAVRVQRLHELRFRVTPRDERKLGSIAEVLVLKATMSTSARERQDARLSLEYLRDPVALPHLRRLAMLDLDALNALDAIERIGGAAALDMLMDLSNRRTGVVAERAKKCADRVRGRLK